MARIYVAKAVVENGLPPEVHLEPLFELTDYDYSILEDIRETLKYETNFNLLSDNMQKLLDKLMDAIDDS